jgi:hypothetical protein
VEGTYICNFNEQFNECHRINKKMTYMDVVETCNLNVQFDELHTHKQEKIQRHIQLPKLN